MRVFKFRAFIENRDGTYESYDSDPVFPHIFWENINEGIYDRGPYQYTGLKDKNDIEICEGDIVTERNSYNNDSMLWEQESSGIVKFGHGTFYIDNDIEFSFWDENSEFEIIGNINQNPELLKENV